MACQVDLEELVRWASQVPAAALPPFRDPSSDSESELASACFLAVAVGGAFGRPPSSVDLVLSAGRVAAVLAAAHVVVADGGVGPAAVVAVGTCYFPFGQIAVAFAQSVAASSGRRSRR